MNEPETFHLTATQVFGLMARAVFRPFNDYDWEGFLGCESETPHIAFVDDYTLVLDGDTLNVVHAEDVYGGQLFNLTEN